MACSSLPQCFYSFHMNGFHILMPKFCLWGLHLWCCALSLKKDWTSKENSSRDQQVEHWRKENKFFIHNSWCSQQDKLLGIYSKNPAALITWNIWHTLGRRNLPRQWNSKYQWNGHRAHGRSLLFVDKETRLLRRSNLTIGGKSWFVMEFFLFHVLLIDAI